MEKLGQLQVGLEADPRGHGHRKARTVRPPSSQVAGADRLPDKPNKFFDPPGRRNDLKHILHPKDDLHLPRIDASQLPYRPADNVHHLCVQQGVEAGYVLQIDH